MKPNPLLTAAPLALLFCAVPATAQQAAPTDDQADAHHLPAEIVVTGAVSRNRQDVLSGVAVIQGGELAQAIRPSIGETLEATPGVSATSFGPTASRPVLRGLQGERVRVLTDGIGAIDVSNTSVDHAAVVNPLLAERIEVLRGPQSLLYGSSAIGGVVNVIDRRLPSKLPEEPVHLGAIATYGSAAEERSLSAAGDVRFGGGWVIHADGSWSKSGNLRIGGPALTPALRAQARASSMLPPEPGSDIDFAANAAVSGTLPNTSARSWNAGAGASYIDAGGVIGIAYSRTDSLYGVPIRFATLPGQEQEAPRIHLQQDRIDGRAEITAGGAFLDRIAFRMGYADYRHAELDPAGAVGTTFLNKGIEARLELAQARRGGWTGASGMQAVIRDFDVIGDEAFLPKNTTTQFGLFTLQNFETGPWKFEAGLRFEHARLRANPLDSQMQFARMQRGFDTVSGALGGAYDFAPGWKLGINLSHTERAPAAEELFANGPHAGTEAYEIGDPALKVERARSVEAVLRGGGAGWSLEASVYHTWFANFVFDAATGAIVDGLPVFQVRQADARYRGFELQAEATLARFDGWTIKADGLADFVHATIASFGPAPRIPPLRVRGGIGLESGKLDLRGEVERVTAQTRLAPGETATPGHTMVNAEIAWRPWGGDRPLSFAFSAHNLLDAVARRHASYLKDYAPLAGRDLRVTARLEL